MRAVRARPRHGIIAALVAAAGVGIVAEGALPGVRDWLWNHAFTTGILVGALMISATYLVVERALEDGERRRWAAAAGPLLQAIAAAGAGTDAEVRSPMPDTGGGGQCEWLAAMLERYQAALTGTPELVEHWHAALSLAQHARTVHLRRPVTVDAEYEAAWERFKRTFGDVHDFAEQAPGPGATWAALPAVRP